MRRRYGIAAIVGWCVALATPAHAITDFTDRTIYQGLTLAPERADGTPKLIGQFNPRFFDYDTVSSQTPGGRQNNFFADIRLNLAWFQTKNLSIQGMARYSQVEALTPYSSGFLENQAVYVENLFAQYETDSWRVFGGKIDPLVGIAWDRAPIMFGQDNNGSYRLKEKIGIGGSYKFSFGKGDHHVVEASLFRADTGFLSTSYITRPEFGQPLTKRVWHNRIDYGGVSNTAWPSSVGAAVYGSVPWLSQHADAEATTTGFRYDVTSAPGLNYMISGSYQAPGTNSYTPNAPAEYGQTGVIGTLMQAFPVSRDIIVTPFVEVALFNNWQGSDQKAQFLTAYVETKLGPNWTVQLAATPYATQAGPQMQKAGKPNDVTNNLYMANLVYIFDFGLQVGAGVKRQSQNNAWSTTPGVFANYYLRF